MLLWKQSSVPVSNFGSPDAGVLTFPTVLIYILLPFIFLSSGWDVEMGTSDGISPDVLVSLGAPKQCATRFMGKHHLVAGRFLPYDVQKKFELNLPEYPGTECVVSL